MANPVRAPCLVCILLLVVVTLTSPVLGEVEKITVGSIAKVPSDGAGPFVHMSVGRSGVYAVNNRSELLYRNGTMNDYNSMGTGWINHGDVAAVTVDVGEGGLGYLMVYNGVSHLMEMTPHEDDPFAYKRYGVSGVVAYDYTSFLGVWATFNEYNDVWLYWRSSNAWYWIPGLNLTQITAGEAGVWGVTSDNSLYYRAGTAGGALRGGTKDM